MHTFQINNKCVTWVLRILVGGSFMLSALLKYLSIETFDLYIYEHHLFGYQLTEIFSRLLVAAEFCLGAMLLAGIFPRLTKWTVFCFLAGFTIYLWLMPYLFQVDMANCHCFGEKLPFTRNQSIVKNLLLMALLLPLSTQRGCLCRHLKRWVAVGVAVVVTVVMAVNPPSLVYNALYGEKILIDNDLYKEALANTGQMKAFSQGRQIVCLYSPTCKYCQLSAQKLHLAFQQAHLDESQMKVIFLRMNKGDERERAFFQKNRIPPLEYTTFAADTFLQVTHGKIPVILFVDEGKVCHSHQYMSVDEGRIGEFLR
ncbi:MAG: DoxX family protein [Bacteroidales bacterium]|nr:DoxX family protein [Bacteroidales bacterium]